MEVDFVLDGFFFPAGAGEHASAGFYHARMAAEVGGGVGRRKIPDFDVFADEVVDATEFAMPVGIVPWAADGRDVFQPGRFGGDFSEFIAITKFMDVAGTLHAEEAMLAGHRCAASFPILVKRADVADIGSDAGDGGDKQMIFAAAAQVESEAPFGETAEEELGVLLHFVEEGRELALGDALDEEFENGFVRRGGDRVGTLKAFVVAHFDAERGVLAGEIRVRPPGIDFQNEEVLSDFTAIKDTSGKKFIWTGDQESPQGIGCEILRNVTGGEPRRSAGKW